MNKRFATFISTIFHPVFINLLNLWLLFNLFPALSHGLPLRLQLFYISFIFIATSIIPLIMVLVMRMMGKIKSIMLQDKEDRKLIYLITMLLYVFCFYYFIKFHTHPLILSYLIACSVISGLVMAINFFDKISIHTATLGGLAGIVAVAAKYTQIDLRLMLALIIISSGIVASARIFANSHKNMQVYTGFVLGFVLMIFIL